MSDFDLPNPCFSLEQNIMILLHGAVADFCWPCFDSRMKVFTNLEERGDVL